MLIVPDVGERWLLLWIAVGLADLASDNTGASPAQLHLFSNPHTVSADSVLGDFVETVYDGYFPQKMLNPVVDPNNTLGRATLRYPQQSYVPTGPIGAVIHGYFVTDSFSNTRLFWAENLPTPLTLIQGGAPLLINPTLTLQSEYPDLCAAYLLGSSGIGLELGGAADVAMGAGGSSAGVSSGIGLELGGAADVS